MPRTVVLVRPDDSREEIAEVEGWQLHLPWMMIALSNGGSIVLNLHLEGVRRVEVSGQGIAEKQLDA